MRVWIKSGQYKDQWAYVIKRTNVSVGCIRLNVCILTVELLTGQIVQIPESDIE